MSKDGLDKTAEKSLFSFTERPGKGQMKIVPKEV